MSARRCIHDVSLKEACASCTEEMGANAQRMVDFDFSGPVFEATPTLLASFEYDHTLEAQEKAVAAVKAAGFTVVYGKPDTLLLDLDAGAVVATDCLKVLTELLEMQPTVVKWPSKSGNGEHVVLHFRGVEFTEQEAVALEMALGSDRKRGLLYIARLRNNVPNPRMLFKPAT